MEMTVTGRHVDVTPAIREYAGRNSIISGSISRAS
jgi:ribosome-associated translation inhibitor RaiA